MLARHAARLCPGTGLGSAGRVGLPATPAARARHTLPRALVAARAHDARVAPGWAAATTACGLGVVGHGVCAQRVHTAAAASAPASAERAGSLPPDVT